MLDANGRRGQGSRRSFRAENLIDRGLDFVAAQLWAEEHAIGPDQSFIASHTLTAEQMQWLSLVHDHLVKNLPMDEEDFDLPGFLNDRGGIPPGTTSIATTKAVRSSPMSRSVTTDMATERAAENMNANFERVWRFVVLIQSRP